MFSKQIQGNDVSQHLTQEFSFPHVFRYNFPDLPLRSLGGNSHPKYTKSFVPLSLPHIFGMGSRARYDRKCDPMPSIECDPDETNQETADRSRSILFEDAHISQVVTEAFRQEVPLAKRANSVWSQCGASWDSDRSASFAEREAVRIFGEVADVQDLTSTEIDSSDISI